MTEAVAEMDMLDEAVASGPEYAILMAMWKGRHDNPEMTFRITEQDIRGLMDCMAYLGVTPQVRIYRPEGRPAQEAVPAQGSRRGIPAHPGEPPRPFVVVQVVDADGNSIKPIENDEEGAKRRDHADMLRALRDKAPRLAAELTAGAQSGTFSTDTIIEAAQALMALAKA